MSEKTASEPRADQALARPLGQGTEPAQAGGEGAAHEAGLHGRDDNLGTALARMDGNLREQVVTQWQHEHGNAFVQRTLAVQRQPPAPGAQNPPAGPLPTFTARYIKGGPNFDADYTPTAPVPNVDTFKVTHKVFIEFKPFDDVKNEEPYKNMKLTKAQKADFKWTSAEQDKFTADFIDSIHKGWSDKHKLHLKDPTFSEYRAAVDVRVVQAKSEAEAHTKIKALKIPKGAPRYRSHAGEQEATLDIRDPSEPEKHQVRERQLVRQVKPFGFDSADTTPVESQLGEISGEMKKLAPAGAKPTDPMGDDWNVFFVGRASAKGSRAYNDKLGQRRADAVKLRINALMGWSGVGHAISVGEEHASEDEQFQRVDVTVTNKQRHEVEQNTAAHEFGHMLGFDDEYTEEDAGKDSTAKFMGEEPEHYQKIKDLMGEDAAKETLRQDSGSIMSVGGEVKRGHYVFFLEAINGMTGKNWTVE